LPATTGSLQTAAPDLAMPATASPARAGLCQRLLAPFTDHLGVDAGTANTLVYAEGRGIVLQEPTVIAVAREDGDIVAIGREAKRMIGRTPQGITTIRPVRSGVIADFERTRLMLRRFFETLDHRRALLRPRVVMAIPSGATEVERRAVLDIVLQAGARVAVLVEEPLAAAIGAGLPIEEPSGCMVVSVGGGTTEVAVTSMGGVVARSSVRVAGDEMDQAIMDHMRYAHALLIGQPTAEVLKIGLGSLSPAAGERMAVHGRDSVTGLPREVEVTGLEVRHAIASSIEHILTAVEATLAATPPELAADVMDRGILLTGGMAQLPGLAEAVAERTSVPASVADEPLLAVARGVGRLAEEARLRRRILPSPRRQRA
jgi:rod shape-determining protein MreB